MTVRQTAGLSAKGQPTDVDAGLPELVQLNILDRTGVVPCSCGNAVLSDGDGDESGAIFLLRLRAGIPERRSCASQQPGRERHRTVAPRTKAISPTQRGITMSLAEWWRLQESHEFEILAGRDDPAWRGVSGFV